MDEDELDADEENEEDAGRARRRGGSSASAPRVFSLVHGRQSIDGSASAGVATVPAASRRRAERLDGGDDRSGQPAADFRTRVSLRGASQCRRPFPGARTRVLGCNKARL